MVLKKKADIRASLFTTVSIAIHFFLLFILGLNRSALLVLVNVWAVNSKN